MSPLGRQARAALLASGVALAAAALAVAIAVAALARPPAPGGTAPGGTARGGPGTITTVAGGIGGPGAANSVALATCPLSYARGALYAGDDAAVRRIDMRTGRLTTVAGDGIFGGWGNGGLAAQADLQQADTPFVTCRIAPALDPGGNLLIAADQIRVVAARSGRSYGQHMLAGHIYTLPAAGRGNVDVRVDRAGNVVTIADIVESNPACRDCLTVSGVVRVLARRTGTFYGTPMRAGRLYTIAGGRQNALVGALSQMALDAAGNVLIADDGWNTRNSPATPPGIRVIAARDGDFYGHQMTAGDIYTIAGGGRLRGDGVRAASAAIRPTGVACDAAGNVIVADGALQVIAARDGVFYGRRMRAGRIYTVAGDSSARARTAAEFVAVDGAGNLVFADQNFVSARPKTGAIRVVAARAGVFYGVAMKAGHVYTVAGSRSAREFGGPANGAPLPDNPIGVAEDRWGDLAIGFVTQPPAFVPARTGRFFGVRMRAGWIYRIPVAASGLGRCAGAVAADQSGNVLIADRARNLALVAPIRSGTFYGMRMRAGRVYRLAGDGRAALSGAGGPARDAGLSALHVVADGQGDVFIVDNAEAYTVPGERVLMIPARSGTFYGIAMTAGHIYPVAGDGGDADRNAVAATHSGMHPSAVAVDAHGNLVVAAAYQVHVAAARQEFYSRVRVIAARDGEFYGRAMRTGYIYTVAGPFPGAHDVAIDPRGDILVLDAEAKVVRLVAAGSGYRYGLRVAPGRVYVVAGRGRGAESLADPQAIAVGPDGRLVIADQSGQVIKAVSP